MSDKVFFTDQQGIQWAVSEDSVDPHASSAAESAGALPRADSLRFESDLEVRLLWTYPDDWRRLSPAQLEALCDRANTVIARFPRDRRAADGDIQARGQPPSHHR